MIPRASRFSGGTGTQPRGRANRCLRAHNSRSPDRQLRKGPDGSARVQMMQPADQRQLDHLSHLGELCCTRLRRVLSERWVGSASVQLAHRRESSTQSPRSALVSRGRLTERFRTPSWCRSARFSMASWRRLRNKARQPKNRQRSRLSTARNGRVSPSGLQRFHAARGFWEAQPPLGRAARVETTRSEETQDFASGGTRFAGWTGHG